MASLQAEIGWKRPSKRENTNYHFVSFLRNRKFQTNSKKIQKIRRIPFWLHLKQKEAEKCQ